MFDFAVDGDDDRKLIRATNLFVVHCPGAFVSPGGTSHCDVRRTTVASSSVVSGGGGIVQDM